MITEKRGFTSFSYLHQKFKYKYKMEGTTEKIKNHQRFYTGLDLSIHAKKRNLKVSEMLPLNID